MLARPKDCIEHVSEEILDTFKVNPILTTKIVQTIWMNIDYYEIWCGLKTDGHACIFKQKQSY